MPTLQIPNSTIYYVQHQAGETLFPPLILVHGAGGQYVNWPPQVRRLKNASVYAVDLPGHGQSTGRGHQDITTYAIDLLAILDALELEQAILVGHSMGGAVVQQIALSAPDRVAGLVLVATSARLRVAPQILEQVYTDLDSVIDFVTTNAFGPTADKDLVRLGRRLMAETPPDVMHGDYLACDAFDLREQITHITAPTLVIGGPADRMTPVKFSHHLAESIPGAELHIIEDAGHMIMSEYPDQVAGLIAAWLAQTYSE